MVGAAVHASAEVGGVAVGLVACPVDVPERPVGGKPGPDREAHLLVDLLDFDLTQAILPSSSDGGYGLEGRIVLLPFDGRILHRLLLEVAAELNPHLHSISSTWASVRMTSRSASGRVLASIVVPV